MSPKTPALLQYRSISLVNLLLENLHKLIIYYELDNTYNNNFFNSVSSFVEWIIGF